MNNLRFVKHVSKDGDDEYLILEEYPEIDYTLLIRDAKYEPYVAAWAYNKEGHYWGQGHYFSSLLDATNYINNKLAKHAINKREDVPQIVGIVHSYGDEDMSLWMPDYISQDDQDAIGEILEKYRMDGSSVRNCYEQITEIIG